MAATTAGAIKAYIESKGLGLTVFHDRPPEGQALPYVTVQDGISLTPDATVDNAFDDADVHTFGELVQVDLWQTWKNPDRSRAESLTLAPALARALHGSLLATSPTRVWGVMLVNAIRLPDLEANMVRNTMTLRVQRDL